MGGSKRKREDSDKNVFGQNKKNKITRKNYSKKQKIKIAKEQNWECNICNEKISLDKYNLCLFDIDHIIELAEGGSNKRENLQALCLLCHRKKTNEFRYWAAQTRKWELLQKIMKDAVEEDYPEKQHDSFKECCFYYCNTSIDILYTNKNDPSDYYCSQECVLNNSKNPIIERLNYGNNSPKDVYQLKRHHKKIKI